jgi:cytoskeletal protein RodZ
MKEWNEIHFIPKKKNQLEEKDNPRNPTWRRHTKRHFRLPTEWWFRWARKFMWLRHWRFEVRHTWHRMSRDSPFGAVLLLIALALMPILLGALCIWRVWYRRSDNDEYDDEEEEEDVADEEEEESEVEEEEDVADEEEDEEEEEEEEDEEEEDIPSTHESVRQQKPEEEDIPSTHESGGQQKPEEEGEDIIQPPTQESVQHRKPPEDD